MVCITLGTAVGKPCRVPYLKGCFEVKGLPEGIAFRKPYHYGANQIREIMEASNEIEFVLTTQVVDGENGRTKSSQTRDENVQFDDVKEVLLKIVNANVVDDAMASEAPQKIKEEDVEVMNLVLSDEQRMVLYLRCQQFFSNEAWLAVGKNMKHPQEKEQLILPIYTKAVEKFWLFCADAKPADIHKSRNLTKIRGNWLDLQCDGKYIVLPEQVSVLGRNIIRTQHGPLYFSSNGNLTDNTYDLPNVCKTLILSIVQPKFKFI
jgi:hypothetical protein